MHPEVVIVGAGQAAMSVARSLREQGHAGRITVVGDEPLPPYERPPLSKQFLSVVPAPAPTLFAPQGWWSEHAVQLFLNERVVRIDPQAKRVCLASGEVLSYQRLVLATGGRARSLGLGATLRTAADALLVSERLDRARSLCVVGGGFLGLEIAASARQRGLDVNVFEAADRLLPAVIPAELSQWFQDFHARHGTHVHCGVAVQELTETAAGTFAFNAAGTQREADCLIASVGMVPNASLAEEAGLRVAGGVVVDEQCRTSDPDILAVGDVACSIHPESGRPCRTESWQNAEYQGTVAASTIMGAAIPAAPVRWFWTEQYGVSIQVLGALDGALAWRGSASDPSFVVLSVKEGRVVGGLGVNAGKELAPIRQLIALAARTSVEEVVASRSMRDLLGVARARA